MMTVMIKKIKWNADAREGVNLPLPTMLGFEFDNTEKEYATLNIGQLVDRYCFEMFGETPTDYVFKFGE